MQRLTQLGPLAMLCALTACASHPASTPTTASAATKPTQVVVRVPDPSAACSVFRPVYWSTKDTPETVVAVKANNAAGKALCGPTWR